MTDQSSRSEYRQAISKITALCSKSEKCTSEVVLKLKEWELTEEEIAKVVEFLVSEKYVDDCRYAVSFVHDKFRFNKWGRIKIAYMLRQKEIGATEIADALDEITDNAYRDTIISLLKPKLRTVKGRNDYEKTAKLAAFAQSHGFEAELSFQIAQQLLGGQDL